MTRLISYSASSRAWRGARTGSSSPGGGVGGTLRMSGSSFLERSGEAAEPVQGQQAAGGEQRERAGGEGGGDLAADVLAPDLRAELLVDGAELVGVAGREGAAAGDLGDLAQRGGVGRDALGLLGARRGRHGDRAAR